MNREIKFRAFHTESKEMLHGSLREIGQWLDEKQPIEVMQYTGLKDKNGKEIYEGDIVKFRQGYIKKTVVYWNGEMTGFYPLLSERSINLEISGNIHQSPELL